MNISDRTTAAPIPETELVKIVDGERVWEQPWHMPMLIAGLVRDGLNDGAARWLTELAGRAHPKDLASLLTAVRDATPSSERSEALAALTRLSEIARYNDQCYRRLTAEDERVKAWPNNPRTKIADPDFYFDIFKDLPFRNRAPIVTATTPIGSAGSCFALRIAHQLQHWGYNYVIEEDDLPPGLPLDQLSKTAFRSAPARCGTLFNTPSMRQMVERAFGVWEPDRILVKDGKRLLDPFRSIKANYSDEQGFSKDYQVHTEALRQALLKCDVFIFTLGLTEAWKFAHSGEYTSVAPHRIDPGLLRRHQLSVEENVEELERMFQLYSAHKPGIKFIISVSPVPLNKTFSETDHVVTANSLSKATLRVAAEEFCRRHPGEAYYFPSYEVVTCGTRQPWESDMRHVSADAVNRVMLLFRAMFMQDQNSNLPLLSHDPMRAPWALKTRAKGAVKAALRSLGLYRRK